MSIPQAQSIDEVLSLLDDVIVRARRESSRMGYFPALYRRVTARVQEGIRRGEFDDNARMERLDVNFANRYIEAVHQHWNGQRPTSAWHLAFGACEERAPIVLQHLMLGMNAHINLDLGIAAARTCPGDELPALRNDFNKINGVLASLVAMVQSQLTQVWPLLGPLDRLAGIDERVVINFSMEKARDAAWRMAERLGPMTAAQQEPEVASVDGWVGGFGHLLLRPALFSTRVVLAFIRWGERQTVPQTIDTLMN